MALSISPLSDVLGDLTNKLQEAEVLAYVVSVYLDCDGGEITDAKQIVDKLNEMQRWSRNIQWKQARRERNRQKRMKTTSADRILAQVFDK